MLVATALRKTYAGRTAVDGITLHLDPGRVLALLGPNGAGKSTTVGMLAGLVTPDAGQVTVSGIARDTDIGAYKRRIGLVPQDVALYMTLPAIRNIELFGALYGLPKVLRRARAEAALAAVGLADRAGDTPATFSGGMQRRLNIACALVHDPDVLLFDEPTASVDPQSRNAIFTQIEALKARGKAIVYTTHYMEEAERLADRIVVIDHGRIVADGDLPALLRLLPASETLEVDCDGTPDLGVLGTLPGVRSVQHAPGRLTLGIDDLAQTAPAALQALAAGGCHVRRVASGRATLEDVFLHLTGRQLRD